jgi:hypothetical protein
MGTKKGITYVSSIRIIDLVINGEGTWPCRMRGEWRRSVLIKRGEFFELC